MRHIKTLEELANVAAAAAGHAAEVPGVTARWSLGACKDEGALILEWPDGRRTPLLKTIPSVPLDIEEAISLLEGPILALRPV